MERAPETSEGELRLEAKAPTDPGVYAFVVDQAVVYIGLTNAGLKARLDQYRVGHQGQRTNARVKALIIETLSKGHTVTVLVAMPVAVEWNGLPVITAEGLEAGLTPTVAAGLEHHWHVVRALTSRPLRRLRTTDAATESIGTRRFFEYRAASKADMIGSTNMHGWHMS